MECKLMLAEGEWQVVLDALERELKELPTEIHHTDNRKYRLSLKEHREFLEAVIARIREQTGSC